MLQLAIWLLIIMPNVTSSLPVVTKEPQCNFGFSTHFLREMCLPVCSENQTSNKDTSQLTNRTCVPDNYLYYNHENSTTTMENILPNCFPLTLDDSTIMNLTYDKRIEFAKSVAHSQTSDSVTTCFPISNYLKQCHQLSEIKLHQSTFFSENLTLLDTTQDRYHTLGNYLIIQDAAIVCNDPVPRQRKYCQPITLTSSEYRISTPHHGLHLPWRKETIHFAEYTPSDPIDFCYPFSENFLRCIRFEIPFRDVTFLPNRSMYNYNWKVVIELGDYYNYSETGVAVCAPLRKDPVTFDVYRIHGVFYVISTVCLFLTLLVHLVFPKTNHHAKPLLCYISSLAMAYVGLAYSVFSDNNTVTSKLVVFAILHYFGLTTFFWLNVLSFDLWHNFSKLNNRIGGTSCICFQWSRKSSLFVFYSVYAWLVPALMTATAYILEFNPSFQLTVGLPMDISVNGWLTDTYTAFVFFFGPLALILVENFIMFLLTVWNLHRASRGAEYVNKNLKRQMLTVFIKLFIVMGLFWSLEFASWATGSDRHIWQVPDLINAMLGIIIFIIFVCKPSTLKLIAGKLSTGHSLLSSKTKTSDVVTSSQTNLNNFQRNSAAT